ncbi:hypothetical protein F4779DRAFT_621435 [Xylariaceae sp. FL0662B]|nr:hypothetical protein F4779DRAFT_621435 [Xylariaceae sp. FL0662B]
MALHPTFQWPKALLGGHKTFPDTFFFMYDHRTNTGKITIPKLSAKKANGPANYLVVMLRDMSSAIFYGGPTTEYPTWANFSVLPDQIKAPPRPKHAIIQIPPPRNGAEGNRILRLHRKDTRPRNKSSSKAIDELGGGYRDRKGWKLVRMFTPATSPADAPPVKLPQSSDRLDVVAVFYYETTVNLGFRIRFLTSFGEDWELATFLTAFIVWSKTIRTEDWRFGSLFD